MDGVDISSHTYHTGTAFRQGLGKGKTLLWNHPVAIVLGVFKYGTTQESHESTHSWRIQKPIDPYHLLKMA